MGCERLLSPEWGRVGAFKYQSRCLLCHGLFCHRFEFKNLCDRCAKRR